MNTKTFDPNKPVQTRDGRKARILASDKKTDSFPIVALVEILPEGKEATLHYTKDGKFDYTDTLLRDDLINIPEKHTIERWINIYEFPDNEKAIAIHQTEMEAIKAGLKSNIKARKKLTIEYVEGEGLD